MQIISGFSIFFFKVCLRARELFEICLRLRNILTHFRKICVVRFGGDNIYTLSFLAVLLAHCACKYTYE